MCTAEVDDVVRKSILSIWASVTFRMSRLDELLVGRVPGIELLNLAANCIIVSMNAVHFMYASHYCEC